MHSLVCNAPSAPHGGRFGKEHAAGCGLLALLALQLAGGVSPSQAASYHCEMNGKTALIDIEVEDPRLGLPCHVVHQVGEQPPRVLWTARHQADFCASKVEETRFILESRGWSCSPAQEASTAETALDQQDNGLWISSAAAAKPVREVSSADLDAFRCQNSQEERTLRIDYLDPQTRLPCELRLWADDAEVQSNGDVLWRAVHQQGFCRNKMQETMARWAEEGWQCAPETARLDLDPDKADILPPADRRQEAAGASATDPKLQAVIDEDVQTLSRSIYASLEAKVAAQGDLNGDGMDDAIVVFDAVTKGSTALRYLMAYGFDGETYHLIDAEPLAVGGDFEDQADMARIEDGIIRLELAKDSEGEAGCCADEVVQAAFIVRDQQLMRLASDGGADPSGGM